MIRELSKKEAFDLAKVGSGCKTFNSKVRDITLGVKPSALDEWESGFLKFECSGNIFIAFGNVEPKLYEHYFMDEDVSFCADCNSLFIRGKVSHCSCGLLVKNEIEVCISL